MKIVFFGSSAFGLPSLKALVGKGEQVLCCVTQPDRKKGRGLTVASTPIKEFARDSGIAVFQPENINTPSSIELLKGLAPDLFLVIAYGQILSQDILAIPKFPAINAHASLLPNYRGAAPINWAIAKGEVRTGVTIITMTRQMDAGPMLVQKEVVIHDDETAEMLESRLALLAIDAVQEAMSLLGSSHCEGTPQDVTRATYAPKLKKQDGLIRWERSAQEIYNHVRAFSQRPGAFTFYRDTFIKVHKVRVCDIDRCTVPDAKGYPGEVLYSLNSGIAVACGSRNVVIEVLQPEGKKPMTAAEFLSGHKLSPGTIFKE